MTFRNLSKKRVWSEDECRVMINAALCKLQPPCEGGCVPPPPYWSCKNPRRILEHDESDPPRYWCRKVQP